MKDIFESAVHIRWIIGELWSCAAKKWRILNVVEDGLMRWGTLNIRAVFSLGESIARFNVYKL